MFYESLRLWGGSVSNQPVSAGWSAKERPSRAWGEGEGGEAPSVVFYVGLRLWEAGFEGFYKGLRLWEARSVVFYEGLRLWEARFVVFYEGPRLWEARFVRVLRVGEALGGSDV